MAQIIRKIYLHWSATDYNWAASGVYHTVVQGNGAVRRLVGYDQPLMGHTRARNGDAVSLCLACMGDNGWTSYPPTSAQIDSLCMEVANLAFQLRWKPDEITTQRVLTLAEAAANRDFPLELAQQVSGWSKPNTELQVQQYSQRARALGLPHENYGPSRWTDNWATGYQERWDLWQLSPSDQPGEGGIRLREKIRQYLQQAMVAQAASLKRRVVPLHVNDRVIASAQVLANNRSYAKLSDLLQAYRITASWNPSDRYVNLKTSQYQVKYLAAAPLFLGFPTLDIYLNRPEDASGLPICDPQLPSRPFMQAIILDGNLHVSVADFCQELGIALRVAQDLSIYLGASAPPVPAPTPAPNPEAPAKPSDIIRTCDIYLGETTLIGKGYLLADNRCYVKVANLAAAYNLRLAWNNRLRYLNVIAAAFQAIYLEDTPPVSGYAVVPLFLNRLEDSQGQPIDPANAPARPFMQGIIMENSVFVAIAEFCRELSITIRVDSDFSIHLGSRASSPTSSAPTSSAPTSSTPTSSTPTSSGMTSSTMPPYITTPPPTTPPPTTPPPTTPPPTAPPSTTPPSTTPPPTTPPPTTPPPTTPPPTTPPPTPTTYVDYVVRSGDTLVRIARDLMGPNGDWRVIAQINNISNPSQLRVGQVLKVPVSSDTVPTPTPEPVTPQPAITDTYTNYVVKAGDTLTKLASTFLGSDKAWRLIGVLNNIADPNQLTVGQTLRIPPRQVTVPTVINTLDGKRPASREVVSFSVDQDLVYVDRSSGQPRERLGRFYEKGLYRGGDKQPKNFISSASSQLQMLKLSDSEIRVITTVAENEGSLDAINTWDDSFLSFGIFQWTAGAENSSGELGALLRLLKDQAPETFQHYFGQFGLDVVPESTTTGWLTLNGQRLTSTAQKSVLRQPLWAYRFAIAGADTMVQSVQVLHAINRLDRFYFSPQQSLQNIALSQLITSEYGVALLLDNHVNRPGYVVSCVVEALKQVGITATQLANGTEATEKQVIDRYLSVRQTYGRYPMTDARERGERAQRRVSAGQLSDRRNSFVSNRQLRSSTVTA